MFRAWPIGRVGQLTIMKREVVQVGWSRRTRMSRSTSWSLPEPRCAGGALVQYAAVRQDMSLRWAGLVCIVHVRDKICSSISRVFCFCFPTAVPTNVLRDHLRHGRYLQRSARLDCGWLSVRIWTRRLTVILHPLIVQPSIRSRPHTFAPALLHRIVSSAAP